VFSLNWHSFFSSQWGKVSSEVSSLFPILDTYLCYKVFDCVRWIVLEVCDGASYLRRYRCQQNSWTAVLLVSGNTFGNDDRTNRNVAKFPECF